MEEIEEQENTIRELERALKAKENPLKVTKWCRGKMSNEKMPNSTLIDF